MNVIPSDVDNYDDIRTELPPEKLKLEWVYGYRERIVELMFTFFLPGKLFIS